jgi:hypothetical protein
VLQVSSVHGLPSLQTRGVPAVQIPLWHVSLPLQTLPSEHDVPFPTGLVVQPVAGAQESFVHALPSLQTSVVPAVQTPAWQVSAPLHAFPSEHAEPFGELACAQPVLELQVSVVHGFASTQLSGVPAVQSPP